MNIGNNIIIVIPFLSFQPAHQCRKISAGFSLPLLEGGICLQCPLHVSPSQMYNGGEKLVVKNLKIATIRLAWKAHRRHKALGTENHTGYKLESLIIHKYILLLYFVVK